MKAIGKRIIGSIIKLITLFLAVSIIAFALANVSPVDPVQQYILSVGSVSPEQRIEIEKYWGQGEPPVERYLNWITGLLQGDFGVSLLYRRPVLEVIGEKFSSSLALMTTAWVLSGVTGISLGCIMSMKRNKWIDRVLKRGCLIISSIPTFWMGILFLLIFSVALGWFPIGLSTPIGVLKGESTWMMQVKHMILPAFTLSFASFGSIALHTRQKLVDVLESDYVLFARARGESEGSILRRHGLRNMILPAITLQFASLPEIFGGSILAENVFSYPGLGTAVSAAGLNSDVPLLLGITLFSALLVFGGNLIANILYSIIDPQIREGYQRRGKRKFI